MPTLLVLLFAVHEGFFPLLSWPRSLLYSVMWAIPFSLGLVFATQVEVARRAREADAADDASRRDSADPAAIPPRDGRDTPQ